MAKKIRKMRHVSMKIVLLVVGSLATVSDWSEGLTVFERSWDSGCVAKNAGLCRHRDHPNP